ncbi:MAG TPA: DUF86 domain-containing protein [Bacteroidales bacterium]|nr:DUF86 domain-containing protein [Lentimicrobiaceae bacterium]HOH99067.1 DUF86 domain-containing protein [Bacteroidales bacterium]
MMDQSRKFLSDILRAIELIEQFSSSTITFQAYQADIKTQSAIERQLSILGEAVNMFDKMEPENTLVNARKIVGFRNRLIHAYDAIDPAVVWTIIQKYLPLLKAEVLHKIL